MPRRASQLVAIVLVAIVSSITPSWADGELPKGKFALLVGARQGIGDIGRDFNVGFIGGIEAGYQPASIDRRWSFGVLWSFLWGRLGSADSATSAGTLRIVEANLGVKLRRLVTKKAPLFAGVAVGIAFLRTSLPVPPNGERQNTGPYGGLGMEYYVSGRYLVGIEARFGMYPFDRPRSITYLASIALGR